MLRGARCRPVPGPCAVQRLLVLPLRLYGLWLTSERSVSEFSHQIGTVNIQYSDDFETPLRVFSSPQAPITSEFVPHGTLGTV